MTEVISNVSDFYTLFADNNPNNKQILKVKSLVNKLKTISLFTESSKLTMYSLFLKAIGGKNYLSHINLMEDLGMIVRSRSYKVGIHCKEITLGSVFNSVEPNISKEKMELIELSKKHNWGGKYQVITRLEEDMIKNNLSFIKDDKGNTLSNDVKINFRTNRISTAATSYGKNRKLYVDGKAMTEIDASAMFPTILCKMASDMDPDAEDVQKMQQLIKDGKFYSYMRDKMITKEGGNRASVAKESAQVWFNSSIIQMTKIPNLLSYIKEFPTASEILINMKYEYGISRKKQAIPKKRILFDIFSEKETEVWIKGVMVRLTECGIINTTKHDSVYIDTRFKKDALCIVKEVLTDHFGEFFNIKVK